MGDRTRLMLLAVGLTVTLVACGGNGASTTSAPANLPAVAWWQPISPSAGTPTAIVLYQQQFLDFSHADTTASVGVPSATWSVSSDSAALAIQSSGSPIIVAPTPSPGETRVIYRHPGAATLTAITPIGSATIPVLTYASVDFGCDLRAGGTFPAADPSLGNAAFATAVDSPMTPCTSQQLSYPKAVTFHFPFGATLVTDGTSPTLTPPKGAQAGPEFRLIPASIWRNDFTAIDNVTLEASLDPCVGINPCSMQSARVIVFKTATGAVVKLNAVEPINAGAAIIGYYETTDSTGQFPY